MRCEQCGTERCARCRAGTDLEEQIAYLILRLEGARTLLLEIRAEHDNDYLDAESAPCRCLWCERAQRLLDSKEGRCATSERKT